MIPMNPHPGYKASMRTAVLGHVEWVELLEVDHVPATGEIVHGDSVWVGPAGGGPDAAVQLLKLAGESILFTALGDDALGHRAKEELEAMGLRVEAIFRREPTRRAITHIDRTGERTITVVGPRLAPSASDSLAWDEFDRADAVYVTAGDPEAIRLARSARVLVATARILPDVKESGVELDALVASKSDPAEAFQEGDLDPPPRLVVLTEGAKGGTYRRAGEDWSRLKAPDLTVPIVDRYGAGDAFAGGLTYAIAKGMEDGAAVEFAARCGAAVLGGRGPYEGQRGPD